MTVSSTPKTGSSLLFDSAEPVYVALLERSATIFLNRPQKLNAITRYMWERLHEAITSLSAMSRLRCIVLASTTSKSFSPGCDITEFETCRSNKKEATAYGHLMHATLNAFQACPVPTVARISGLCVGAGLELATTCDIRVASHSSRFGAPIKNLGLVMAYPELEPLLKVAGRDTIMEMLLEGRLYTAQEARERHLVTRIVPDGELEDSVSQTVDAITSGAPLAARWHKKFIRRLCTQSAPVTDAEYDECFDCFDTEDFKTGCQAFARRTRPDFKGK